MVAAAAAAVARWAAGLVVAAAAAALPPGRRPDADNFYARVFKLRQKLFRLAALAELARPGCTAKQTATAAETLLS